MAGEPAAVDPPVATPAAQAVSRRPSGGGADGGAVKTSHGVGPDFDTFGFPARAVPVLRCQRVGNLVQDRVANLIFRIQQHQRARQRDQSFPIPTTPEPPSCVVKAKTPIAQPMGPHQIECQKFGVLGVQNLSLVICPL
jgi:hypothetical protein